MKGAGRRILGFGALVVLLMLSSCNETSDMLAILVDDEGAEYEMALPKAGYKKSLNKAMKYFEEIEEFETCDLIKQMTKQL